jgi:hypothetical protein
MKKTPAKYLPFEAKWRLLENILAFHKEKWGVERSEENLILEFIKELGQYFECQIIFMANIIEKDNKSYDIYPIPKHCFEFKNEVDHFEEIVKISTFNIKKLNNYYFIGKTSPDPIKDIGVVRYLVSNKLSLFYEPGKKAGFLPGQRDYCLCICWTKKYERSRRTEIEVYKTDLSYFVSFAIESLINKNMLERDFRDFFEQPWREKRYFGSRELKKKICRDAIPILQGDDKSQAISDYLGALLSLAIIPSINKKFPQLDDPAEKKSESDALGELIKFIKDYKDKENISIVSAVLRADAWKDILRNKKAIDKGKFEEKIISNDIFNKLTNIVNNEFIEIYNNIFYLDKPYLNYWQD